MRAFDRNPVAASVAGAAALMLVLTVLALTVPMSVNAEHFSGHVALAVPLLFLLVLVLRRWPRPAPELAGRLARGTLAAGLAIAGVGLLTEAVGAFGFSESVSGRANALAVLHDVGVVVWPIGFVLLMVGVILTAGVLLAARRGAAGSRLTISAAVVAVVAVVGFVAGGIIFGY